MSQTSNHENIKEVYDSHKPHLLLFPNTIFLLLNILLCAASKSLLTLYPQISPAQQNNGHIHDF